MRRHTAGVLAAAVLAVGMLSGCSGAPAASPSTDATASAGESASAGTPAATPSAVAPRVETTPSETPIPLPTETATSATAAFLAWLDLSRRPDADAACAGLTPELAARMLAELQAQGYAVSTCQEMITTTAELYRAASQSADVDVAVQSETADDAVLFVTYLDTGDCGTVVMQRRTDWIITELSEECAA